MGVCVCGGGGCVLDGVWGVGWGGGGLVNQGNCDINMHQFSQFEFRINAIKGSANIHYANQVYCMPLAECCMIGWLFASFFFSTEYEYDYSGWSTTYGYSMPTYRMPVPWSQNKG